MTPDSAIPFDGNPADDEISPIPATISEDSTENAPSQGTPADGGVLLYERTFEIHHDLQKRVDLYLRDRLPAYSRAMLQKIIKADSVFVNGHVAKSSTLLRSGDVVRVTLPHATPEEAIPEDIPLEIIYEDDCLIAINKQRDLIVHPARGHWTGTMVNALLFHAQKTHSTLSVGSDPWRPGIIHRLDRDTTGLIMVAKTDEAHWRLAGQFERRTIKKTYIAIVHGIVELDSDLIDAPLATHPKVREKYAVRPEIGKPAQTVYTVLERFRITTRKTNHHHSNAAESGYTLLELAPKTGRTHQLRVHLAHIGHPIVGDTPYGGIQVHENDIPAPGQGRVSNPEPLITRQALHAYRLQFVHPTQFHRMSLEAPVPPDIQHIIDLLRALP